MSDTHNVSHADIAGMPGLQWNLRGTNRRPERCHWLEETMPECSHLCRRQGVDGVGHDDCSQGRTTALKQDGHRLVSLPHWADGFQRLRPWSHPFSLNSPPNQKNEEGTDFL